MAMAACVTAFHLDKAVEIFDSLCSSGVPACHSTYNAALDACAHSTILCHPSTPLPELRMNAAASLSGFGLRTISVKGGQPSLSSFSREELTPFSRANWSKAIQLIVSAIDEGVVAREVLVPCDKQNKDSATLVLDASVMGLGSII